jgi:hypothetical protein
MAQARYLLSGFRAIDVRPSDLDEDRTMFQGVRIGLYPSKRAMSNATAVLSCLMRWKVSPRLTEEATLL